LQNSQENQQSIVDIAKKQRHLFLLQKVRQNKQLTAGELDELARYENKDRESMSNEAEQPQALNDKELLFAKNYLVSLDATDAYMKLPHKGNKCKKTTANVNGYRMYMRPHVKAYIDNALKKQADKLEIKASRVLEEIARIAFSNIGDYLKFSGKSVEMVDSAKLTREQLSCISEVSETKTSRSTSVKFKLYDKPGALQLLGQYLRIFEGKQATPEDSARQIHQALAAMNNTIGVPPAEGK